MSLRFQIRQCSASHWTVFDSVLRRSIVPDRIEADGLSLADAVELSELLNDVVEGEAEYRPADEPHGAA